MSLVRAVRSNPLLVVALALVGWGTWTLTTSSQDDAAAERGLVDCDPSLDALCTPEGLQLGEVGPVVAAETACRNDTGYLCVGLEAKDRVQLRRWKGFSGTVIVHVPRPAFESAGDARRLQAAASAGLRAWNGQPFAILVDEQGNREAHFRVVWRPNLSGSQIGVAQTRWSRGGGLEVVQLELSTRSPYVGGGVISPRQIRLTAAHEMGHALGILDHSTSSRDVMYPTNTATSLSARDYKTMSALYALEDGTTIVR